MENKILLLIKVFDKEEFADKFIQQGEMLCQTIKNFKQTTDSIRGDPYEAVSGWYQPEHVTITIAGTTPGGVSTSRDITDISGPVVEQSHAHDGVNVYCMYAISAPAFNESYDDEEERLQVVQKINAMMKERSKLADEMLSFGEHAVIIYRIPKFIENVQAKAKFEGRQSWVAPVNYFDPNTFSGSFGEIEAIFQKRKCYEYQQEFRFAFFGDQPEQRLFLKLGSLEELAPIKIKTRDINSAIQIRLDESKV